MSWFLHAAPLHLVGEWDGVLDDVPAELLVPRRLPVVSEVLDVLRAAGCHGDSWFDVEGLPTTGEHDLGEVSIDGEDEPLRADTPVESVAFRKPSGAAALVAVCALTGCAGPLLAFDDGGEAFVVRPGDRPDDLAPRWPW